MRAMRSFIVLCGKYEVDSTLLCSDAVALGLGTGVAQRLCGTRLLTRVPPFEAAYDEMIAAQHIPQVRVDRHT